MAAGLRLLRFRCHGCHGEAPCCRSYRVPITAADLMRLVATTQLSAEHLIDWLRPEEVDMTGEPGSFLMAERQRWLPVLRHIGGGCRLLSTGGRCTIHEMSPLSCRAFPLVITVGRSRHESGVRRLRVLRGAPCPTDAFNAASTPRPLAESRRLALLERKRLTELREHTALVYRINQQTKLRRALGLSDPTRLEALEQLLRHAQNGSAKGPRREKTKIC